jgi:hypothetical protein
MAYPYDVDNIFKYHKPFGTQTRRYELIREQAKELAKMILSACPESPERTLALRTVEDAVMWANSSIARNEKNDEETSGA